MSAGDLEAAEEWLRRSLDLRAAKLGHDHPDTRFVADNFDRLANRYLRAEDYDAAVRVMETLLQHHRDAGADDEVAGWLFMLAMTHRRQGQVDLAVARANESLEVLERNEPDADEKLAAVREFLTSCR